MICPTRKPPASPDDAAVAEAGETADEADDVDTEEATGRMRVTGRNGLALGTTRQTEASGRESVSSVSRR